MSNRFLNLLPWALLFVVFVMAVLSIQDDSLTFDETAHIVSGYSYLTQKDMRLNPEHPPLLKDLAAFPLLFLNLNFPKNHASWTQEENPVWWHQFTIGSQFLYYSGNNPDQILFWSRLPMILILVCLGGLIFIWARELFGQKTALLSLFLFSFSPTFLAHGRLVTTDVGAALGVVLATYFWLKFLYCPSRKNIVWGGLIFGIVMLFKFTLILVIPFFAVITLVFAYLNKKGKALISFFQYAGLALLVGIIGVVLVIWPVYQFHVANYPTTRQIRDTEFLLSTAAIPQSLINLDQWMVKTPALRALGQYLLGILLVLNRSKTGHTTYFLGEIASGGRITYFPTVYLIKEPLAFHMLALIALLWAAWCVKKPFWQAPFLRAKTWAKNHFPEFCMFLFVAFYWATSLNSNLNIGVRHLLPVLPFTIMLASKGVMDWAAKFPYPKKVKWALLLMLLIWQAISVVSIWPHFLAYFNEIIGGPTKGHLYVTDSNLDWGQDLKRLKKWVQEKNIDEIYVDYFGGGNPEYYLKEKFAPWWGTRSPEEFERPGYLAISATLLQGGKGAPGPGFDQPWGYYLWLEQYQPMARIGYSIFVYYIE